MIMDGQLLFDSAAAITATANSTNVIDLSQARDLGIGDGPALKVNCQVVTTFQSAGATTLNIQVQGSTDNSSYSVMAQTDAIPKAALVAGAGAFNIDLPRPQPGQAVPRYLRVVYTVATGPFTAGNMTTFLNIDRQENIAYPAGINIAN